MEVALMCPTVINFILKENHPTGQSGEKMATQLLPSRGNPKLREFKRLRDPCHLGELQSGEKQNGSITPTVLEIHKRREVCGYTKCPHGGKTFNTTFGPLETFAVIVSCSARKSLNTGGPCF